MPAYSRDSLHRANFTCQFSGCRGLRNGSERFRRPQVCTVKSSCSWFFQVPVSKPSKKPPCGSKDQGYKSKESEKKQKRLLRDLDVAPGGWGPYCKALSRQGRGMLNTREKVKLDVEFKRLEVSQLFVHGRLGPFQNPACLENCSVESFLSSIIQRNFQPFELHISFVLSIPLPCLLKALQYGPQPPGATSKSRRSLFCFFSDSLLLYPWSFLY